MARSRLFEAAALGAALLGGGVAGAVIATPALTSAQEEAPSPEAPSPEAPDESTTTAPDADEPRSDARGCRVGRRGSRPGLDAAAEVLGVTEEELRDALRGGSSIADVAAERGVDMQAVIDALVAEATARIHDEAVEGDLDADRAAALKERLGERITRLVEGDELSRRSDDPRGAWGRGHRPR